MSETEQWFDQNIAPKLLELAKQCEARGLPFVAQVEYEPGEYSLTAVLGQSPALAMSILYMAAMAKTNVDALFIGIIRHCRNHGIDMSSSAILNRYIGDSP